MSQLLPEARFMLVGGAVRDALMNGGDFEHPTIKDYDVEVFAVQPEDFESMLNTIDLVNMKLTYDKVGQSFGVYKITVNGFTFDFAFPRREQKVGLGYRGFEVEIDPTMSFEEACGRRDLTINAVMYDLLTGEYVDPYNGIEHINTELLCPTSMAFMEDPLRVLRSFQFLSRFNFNVALLLVEYSYQLLNEKTTLTPERVWVEWEKWATKSIVPQRGLKFLKTCGWAEIELLNLLDIPQDPTHHPEGDAFIHTLHVVDAANTIRIREKLNHDESICLMLSALSHDFGKANTTVFNEKKQKWTAYNHQITSVPLAETFLEKINCPLKHRQTILTLVREHMVHLLETPTDKNVKRLINRLVKGKATMRQLAMVVEADCSGRPPLPQGQSPKFQLWLDKMEELGLDGESKIQPIVTGDWLIGQGLQEGETLGTVLRELYEAQISGRFNDLSSGDRFFKQHFKKYINGANSEKSKIAN